MRVARFRKRRLAELWAGTVARCHGPTECPWNVPGGAPFHVECRCEPNVPCRCERELWANVARDAANRFGEVIGALVTGSIIDVLRAQVLGDEGAVRHARLALINTLLADQRRRLDLQQRQERIDLQKSQSPSLRPYAADLEGVLDDVRREVRS